MSVTRLNDDSQQGRAGFYYDVGENALRGKRAAGGGGFSNNSLHISPDIRVVVSPEYLDWRWIDLSGARE